MVPLEQAQVSVEDRGFLFGDGVYEVIRAYGGHFFELGAHMRRLQHSAEGARLALGAIAEDLPALMRRLLVQNDLQDTNMYVQYTRGVAHPRAHAFPSEAKPTLLVMPLAIHSLPEGAVNKGVRAISLPDLRWQRCDIKSTMLLPNILAKQQARERGAFEAIFVRDGLVTEGSSTNTFAVFQGILATHSSGPHILGGVTRDAVVRLASTIGVVLREEAFTLEQLCQADEAFLTSTTSEVLPITQVDDRRIGHGRPGPVTLRLREAFLGIARG
jgi:D-alanine transaminase